jgi:glycosyltransferase involved in cell wall biosynthesis
MDPTTASRRISRPVNADLHIHSRHSALAPEWFFRRIGLADSYSEPRALYDALRSRGMDFVTITDHNRIDGCLEIAGLAGTFISEQLSTRFPEDRTVVQLLVWGITEGQHAELQGLRDNLYDVQRYLAQKQIAHAVAHPFYQPSEPMPVARAEQLVLLFKHFEGINGLRDRLLSDVAREVFTALTPGKIEELANRYGITPTHEEAWVKVLVGGSDDHGGLSPARAYTEAPPAADPAEFLAHIRVGRCEPRGVGGDPLHRSHGMLNNLRLFAGQKFSGAKSTSFVGKAFSRFMEGENPTEFSWTDKLGFLAEGIASGQIFELAKPANASLWRHFAATFSTGDAKRRLAEKTAGIEEPERRAFVIANFFTSHLAFHFFTSFVKKLSTGNPIEAIQDISMLAPVLAPLAPYFYAFQSQAPNRPWLAGVSRALAGDLTPGLRNTKRAWFTDTLEDVNGVANTIRRLTAACRAEGNDLVVVTSRSAITITDIPIKNFPPIGEFELPEYELQKLSFPPILEMVDYIQREGFTELIISTPGPIGITALLAAKVLGLRTSGIYHTDFPQYIRILTDDSFLETLTWSYMKWFYDALDLIYLNSEGYRKAWADRGIAAEKLKILPRGLDTALFHPSRRDPGFWEARGIERGSTVLLYVGRLSKEKDLDVIAAAWRKLKQPGLALAFVGDGPHRAELQRQLPGAIFTGVLAGHELATAFASADVFLFPSTTDTFGNVILEAMASGLPCVVSDQGGPKDLIAPGRTGWITRALDAGDFAEKVALLAGDRAGLETMRTTARAAVEDRDWTEAARRFWASSME